MLVLNLPAFESKKYAAYDRFHGNGPYGEIPTRKEPIRTLGFALPYNNVGYSPVSRLCWGIFAQLTRLDQSRERKYLMHYKQRYAISQLLRTL